jgi:regulatory protein
VRTARAAVIALLARRDYTAHELRTRLRRSWSEEDLDAALADLTRSGVVDDDRVAAAHVRTGVHGKRRGKARIRQELAARGLSRATIDRALATMTETGEAAALSAVLTRKGYDPSAPLAERRRLYQHLLRRGFAPDAIRRALDHTEDD